MQSGAWQEAPELVQMFCVYCHGETKMSENSVPTQKPVAKDRIRTRGAVKGHNVRYVLTFGLVGVIIAFIIIALYFGNLPF
jgi:hypothetical protein